MMLQIGLKDCSCFDFQSREEHGRKRLQEKKVAATAALFWSSGFDGGHGGGAEDGMLF